MIFDVTSDEFKQSIQFIKDSAVASETLLQEAHALTKALAYDPVYNQDWGLGQSDR